MKRSLYVSKLGNMLRDRRLPEDERKRRRALVPVASKVRIIHSPDADATHGPDPFLHWMQETVNKYGLSREILKAMQEPYDLDSMKAVHERGGLKQLIRLMCPYLSAERQAMLYDKIAAICHGKQRTAELASLPALPVADKEHRARRLTRREKREMKEGKGKRVLK
jgi:hypothetical protein